MADLRNRETKKDLEIAALNSVAAEVNFPQPDLWTGNAGNFRMGVNQDLLM